MSLPTKEQFLKHKQEEFTPQWEPYGPPEYQCPKCGEGGMCKDLVKGIVLAVIPPIHQDVYHCNKCGYEETINA